MSRSQMALPVTKNSACHFGRSRETHPFNWRLALTVPFLIALGFSLRLYMIRGERPHITTCLTKVKQLGIAMALYADSADDRLPPADWMTPTYPYVKNWELYYETDGLDPRSPFVKPGRSGFAMNCRLPGLKRSDVDPTCVLLFETDAFGPDVVANLAARSGRHVFSGKVGGSSICRVDTSAKFLALDAPLREAP